MKDNEEKGNREKSETEYVTPELIPFGKLAKETFATGSGAFCDATEDWTYSE